VTLSNKMRVFMSFKIEAPSFDGHFDPKWYLDWEVDMDGLLL